MKIRVGLHTGDVVVQAVESSLYQMYDATGVAVHLASRMEQMADEGAILLTAHTFNEAKQFVEAAPLGERAVRGLPTPVEVFQLTGLKHAPASERFRSGPRLTGPARWTALRVAQAVFPNAIDLHIPSRLRLRQLESGSPSDARYPG